MAVITKDGKLLTTGETGQSKLGRTGSGYGFMECSFPAEIERPNFVSCGGSVSYIICGSTNTVAVSGTGSKGELGLGSVLIDTKDQFKILSNVKFRHISSGSASNSGICAKTGIVYVWGNGDDRVFGKIRENIFTPRAVKLPHQGTLVWTKKF